MTHILPVAIVALHEIDYMSGVAVGIINISCEDSTGDCAFNSVSRNKPGEDWAV